MSSGLVWRVLAQDHTSIFTLKNKCKIELEDHAKLFAYWLFSMSTKDLSYLLVGETSQGRSSDERKVGSDPPNSNQQVLT